MTIIVTALLAIGIIILGSRIDELGKQVNELTDKHNALVGDVHGTEEDETEP